MDLIRFRRTILALACIVMSLSSHAQELGLATPQKDELLKVTAVVQFVDGRALKTETAGVQTDAVYQTALYEGDRLETFPGSTVKIVSREGCFFVLRGEGAIAAPFSTKPWRMRAESVRVLCSARSKNETFGIANEPLVMREGEVLFLSEPNSTTANSKRVMLISGAATLLGQALEPHKLYMIRGTNISLLPTQPDENDLRKLNADAKPPRESNVWPEPEKRSTVRLIFGPAFGGDHASYDTDDLSQGSLSGNGPRVQLHFRTAQDHSIIVAATFRETKDKSQESSSNSPPPTGVSNSIEHQLLEVGFRNRHDRWWSPFWRIGAGISNAKVGYHQTDPSGVGSSYTRYSYDFYVLSATYGIDAHFVPNFLRPFGFYASAEGQIIQSVGRGGRVNENSGYSSNASAPPEPWRLTDVNFGLSLGLQYDF
jgi:hypothetical protein